MSPRALAVHAAIASAAWLALFPAGCAAPEKLPESATGSETIRLRYVTHKRRLASDFKRPLEYFTGHPENGGDAVLPSYPESRDGHWFTFAVGPFQTLPSGAKAVLEVVRSDTPAPVKRTFALPDRPGSGITREWHLGLTGADAPPPKARITAWRITLLDAAGSTLASDRSFLWEIPSPSAPQ